MLITRLWAVVDQALSVTLFPRCLSFSVLGYSHPSFGVKATSGDPPLLTDGRTDKCKNIYMLQSCLQKISAFLDILHVLYGLQQKVTWSLQSCAHTLNMFCFKPVFECVHIMVSMGRNCSVEVHAGVIEAD